MSSGTAASPAPGDQKASKAAWAILAAMGFSLAPTHSVAQSASASATLVRNASNSVFAVLRASAMSPATGTTTCR